MGFSTKGKWSYNLANIYYFPSNQEIHNKAPPGVSVSLHGLILPRGISLSWVRDMSPCPLVPWAITGKQYEPCGLGESQRCELWLWWQGQPPGLGHGTRCAKKECCGTAQDNEILRRGAKGGAKRDQGG